MYAPNQLRHLFQAFSTNLIPMKPNTASVNAVTSAAWPPSHYHAINASFEVPYQQSMEVEITW